MFGSPWFWVISLSFHHLVSKTHGFHRKKSCLAWFLGDVSITQNSKIWVMDDGNWQQNFGVFSFWNMSYDAKGELCDWVMWPNKNFGVFEIKWDLGYELWVLSLSWVMSIELWKLSHGQTKWALSIAWEVIIVNATFSYMISRKLTFTP